MATIVVGISDCQASKDRTAMLVTYALGSCIGLAVYDPTATVGGLLHILLPESSLDAEKAGKNPHMFADTGVPSLLDRCLRLGATKARLRVWLTGGSAVMDSAGVFNIGKRNQLAVRKALWKAGLMVHSEDVGGSGSRTIRLELESGKLWVRGAGTPELELRLHTGLAKGA
jgi:chemotaxis protein CheD